MSPAGPGDSVDRFRDPGGGITTRGWLPAELQQIQSAEELRIAPDRADGRPGREVPVWVVVVAGHAYVRTWHRRDTGWFGHAATTRRAHVRVPGLVTHVLIEDTATHTLDDRAQIDAAYRTKYARYGSATVDRMTTDAAAATTLRLNAGATPGNSLSRPTTHAPS